MTARAAIVHVPPWACAQRMKRGEVRRWAAGGKSFSYVVGCPSCGRPSMVMVEDWGLIEGAIVTSTAPFTTGPDARRAPFDHPATMTSTRTGPACRCPGCGGMLRATGQEIVVDPRATHGGGG